MGWLSDLFGYPIMFRIVAALAGTSLILLFIILRRGAGATKSGS